MKQSRNTAARTIGPSILFFCSLALTSCTVGPNYQRPDVDVPAGFKSATQPTTAPTTAPVVAADWWRLFGDETLNRLEEDATRANTDLQAAVARVTQARAAARVVQSQFYPVITLEPSIERGRTPANRSSSSSGSSSNSTGGTTSSSSRSSSPGGRTSTSVRIPFDLSYEIDVWGRVRRSYEASVAQVRFAQADYQVVLQTLQADVAQNYFNIRALDSQAKILQENVESYKKQIELVQSQKKAGLVGQTDVVQAQTLLNSTTADELDIRRQRADLEHALAVLLGRPPADITVTVEPLAIEPPVIPPGLPADLLRRRPDVLRAEQDLVAANAQVGVATAAFYPTFRLTGAAGFESADLQSALDWESRFWSIGPSVSIPIFEGGQLNANLKQTKARYEELVATYRGSVLSAYRDVEDSLTDLHLRAEEAQARDSAVQSAREYLRLSTVQYKGGLATYLQVIDAERTLLVNEISAVQLLNQRLVSTVLLIKSMGGGWDPHTDFGPPDVVK